MTRASDSKRPRTPGVVYSVLSVVVLLVLGAVAVTTRQPPPPSIAEFAPNAVEKIEDAPDEQTSGDELGDAGLCPPDEPDCDPTQTPTPKPGSEEAEDDPTTIDVPRVRKCIGDPPRQIEDPQSPPCVPYWEGDNGGATYKGVTKDEIRIAMPAACPSVERCKLSEIENAARFFNRRFEFYGRKITIVDTSEDATCDDDDPAGSRATAQAAEEQYKVFASIECGSGDPEYARELGRRGLLFVSYEMFFGVETARRLHPHLWGYAMEPESVFAHMGDWACKRVAGGKARHAGPLIEGDDRVFGVILSPFTGAEINADELTDRLAACGAKPKVVSTETDPDATSLMLRMKNEGVTSVFCLCHILNEAALGRAATAQAYFPEWLVSSYDINYYNHQYKLAFPAEQREHVFGIQVLPMQQRSQDWPGNWACREVDPNCESTIPGVGPYNAMLLLASGIQMAGPNLTPATFGEGLQKAAFPNPDHPIVPGKVGFNRPIAKPDPKYSPAANLPHGMTTDGIEYWWSEASTGPNSEEGNGAMCYVSRKRYRLGEYPEGDDSRFFAGRCDSGGV